MNREQALQLVRQYIANENMIKHCEKLPIPLDEFAGLCLRAMQSISAELGL